MFWTTHALVTGASSGLSREMVRQLAGDRGLTVLATARRLDRLEALAAELPAGCVHVLAGGSPTPASEIASGSAPWPSSEGLICS